MLPEHLSTPEICVLAGKRLHMRGGVRRRLEDARARKLTLSEGREGSLVDRAVDAAAKVDGDWFIVVLDAPARERYRQVVPELIANGFDDVIVIESTTGLTILEQALERAKKTLALAAAIQKTGHLVGQSTAMRALRKAAALCIRTRALPALILGETGTGKGRLARAIHDADPRLGTNPFHTLDCGGITDSLFGSELFGHVRGAFTGALDNRRGAFECAGEGTLLLDEIGELSPSTQSYLLNALQDRTYRPVGSDRIFEVRCRVIAATNRNLERDIEERRFRRDLYYRLNGHCVQLPALRDHLSDVPELFHHFLHTARGESPRAEVEPEVLEFLQSQPYPGNVRELESIAQQVAARMGDEVHARLAHLPFDRMQVIGAGSSTKNTLEWMVEHGMQLSEIEAEISRQTARVALKLWTKKLHDRPRTEVVQQVARSLGVSPRTVYNKLNGANQPS